MRKRLKGREWIKILIMTPSYFMMTFYKTENFKTKSSEEKQSVYYTDHFISNFFFCNFFPCLLLKYFKIFLIVAKNLIKYPLKNKKNCIKIFLYIFII